MTLRGWELRVPALVAFDRSGLAGGEHDRRSHPTVLVEGAVVVSWLGKDAVLFDLPSARTPGQRGRPRKYGDQLGQAR